MKANVVFLNHHPKILMKGELFDLSVFLIIKS